MSLTLWPPVLLLAPGVMERSVRWLRDRSPLLRAVYGFVSRVQGTAGPDSDLAILTEKISQDAARAGLLADTRARGTVYGG
jgi:hypothetical protein